MTITEVADWITERYGTFHLKHSNGIGVFIVAVKVYGGIAFGFGSSRDNAVYDLYCDLRSPAKREPVEGLVLYPWEIEHRKQADAERFG